MVFTASTRGLGQTGSSDLFEEQGNIWLENISGLVNLGNKSKNKTKQGVPGDERCLFRSIVHGACFKAGKPSPSENLQKELADELRAKVVNEFIKRRGDTEWFLEVDFDIYAMQMIQSHIWGGEPELIMSSHVLQMPVSVYLRDKKIGNLKVIAEYGQEYGKENPITKDEALGGDFTPNTVIT
ncbi:hypothetical protein C5167_033164 [Papaver somniferum]|uniref:Ubiquitin thioesterase OTU n=1 Tax=Papaver somniferum TaxID=3469 RepID=A0A4Y7KDJ2_PAPSO|nr:hypothetical protein C5167_033164 [Papaver somniferum]